MSIEFTQYLRPDGRRRQDWIDRPPEIEAKAQVVRTAGYVFEMELLLTDNVSFTVCRPHDQDECIAHEICPNGPAVLTAVDRLVETAYAQVTQRA